MPMTLNDVPESTQTLATTQPLIKTNFSNIDTSFKVDHVPYVSAGTGKHNKVTFPVQASAPSFVLGEVGLYSLLDSNTSANQLNVVSSAGITTPFTAGLKNSNGWAYLPTGMLIKWGNDSCAPGVGVSVTASQGPAFAAVYAIQLTSKVTNNYITLGSFGAGNSFEVTNRLLVGSSSSVTGFTYFMIGNS